MSDREERQAMLDKAKGKKTKDTVVVPPVTEEKEEPPLEKELNGPVIVEVSESKNSDQLFEEKPPEEEVLNEKKDLPKKDVKKDDKITSGFSGPKSNKKVEKADSGGDN